MIAFGIWLHIYQDTLFITYLLKDYSSSSAASAAAAASASNTTFIFDTIPFLLIWIGLFVAAMSFLGCYGACAENVCFLGFVSIQLAHTLIVVITQCILRNPCYIVSFLDLEVRIASFLLRWFSVS